jgi:hypothetical protein
MKVSDLMLQGDEQWDEVKINSKFLSQDAHEIINTPLLPSVNEDKLIWWRELGSNRLQHGHAIHGWSGKIPYGWRVEL